jgi:DNA primase large subunit
MAWVQSNKVANTTKAAAQATAAKGAAPRSRPSLSMYTDMPSGEIALEEFERFALDRLKGAPGRLHPRCTHPAAHTPPAAPPPPPPRACSPFPSRIRLHAPRFTLALTLALDLLTSPLLPAPAVLRGIEDLKSKGKRFDEMEDAIRALADAHLRGATREESARKDAASHFVVRLGFCLTEDKRRWLLAQECDLFRARFRALLGDEQRAFMEANALPYATLSRPDFEAVRPALAATVLAVTRDAAAAQKVAQGAAAHEAFYKVPFEAVPDLVATRRAYLEAGWAYVSREQVASLVAQPFRASLSRAMARLAGDWNSFMARDEAGRLAPLVEGLSQRYLGPDYSDPGRAGAGGAVTAAQLPRLAAESFPLCMATMLRALREAHHLKHKGRQQLGLFLKGIGLPLEEAVRFWRTEMGPHAPGDKFDKEYLYNIRHNYGKEGTRKDYTPHSCLTLVAAVPGAGEVHGCPYRTFGEDALRAALGRMEVAPAKAEEAVGKARAGHFQLACAAAWEGKMGCACDTGINHPNQYYEESRKVLAPGEGGGEAAAAAAAAGRPREGAGGGEEGGPAKVQRVG